MEYVTILLLGVVVGVQSVVLAYTFKRFNPFRKSLSEKELLPSYRKSRPSLDYDIAINALESLIGEGVKDGLTDWEAQIVRNALVDVATSIRHIRRDSVIQDMLDDKYARDILETVNL